MPKPPKKTITLRQANVISLVKKTYMVIGAKNTTQPCLGEEITEKQVNALIEDGIEVTIR